MKNKKTTDLILAKIKEYDKIVISRHLRPDGDALGSTKGLAEALRASFPDKQIILASEDASMNLAFLGPDDGQPDDAFYADALLIALDCATPTRLSNKKYALAKEVIKIDHHPNICPYGDISWIEPERSSVCEMVALFCKEYAKDIVTTAKAACFLYAGMITDSGRFKYSVNGDTMRIAGFLLDTGIDTETLFAQLNLDDYSWLKYKSFVYKHMKMTPNGVAYIRITRKTSEKFALTSEQASETVYMMESIKGCLIWLAFIDYDDGTTRVRLRSRFLHINEIAEKYGGGGHECASGATLRGAKQIKQLLNDCDALLGEYKSTHEGWL